MLRIRRYFVGVSTHMIAGCVIIEINARHTVIINTYTTTKAFLQVYTVRSLFIDIQATKAANSCDLPVSPGCVNIHHTHTDYRASVSQSGK